MTRRSEPAAVLFADIADSSRLYRDLGDRAASALVNELLDALADEVAAEAGRVIDRIGDELMCRFAGPAAAVRAACALQHRCGEFSSARRDQPPAFLRIGLHAGDVLESDGRLFGECIYVAKRLTDEAKAGQVLLAEDVLLSLGETVGAFRFVDEVVLKGQARPTRMHELLWDSIDTTEPREPPAAATRESRVLVLDGFRGTLRLEDGACVKVGRSAPAELLLPAVEVSRLHASILGVRGRFAIHDVSTNGTYVRADGTDEARFVRHDLLFLEGEESGWIGLGAPPKERTIHTLRYTLTRAREP